MTDVQHPERRVPAVGPTLSPRDIATATSKLISASIGDIVFVMSRSPGHKHHSLSDIEWMVLPAVVAGQFYLAEATSKEHGFRAPIACVTWASVSDEVDKRLREEAARNIRLQPDDWKSGEHLWLIDMAGDTRALSGALKSLLETRFKSKCVNVATLDADGAACVQTLADLAAAAQEASE